MSDLCSPLLDNVKQIGAIIEATCGAGGTFTAADFTARISAASADLDMSPQEDDTLTASLSPRKVTMGEKKVTLKVAMKLVGSGVAATKPELDVYLRGCGMASQVVKKVAIGAVTGGPFTNGEIVSQSVSLATGFVVGECRTGDSYLYIVETSGTWASTGTITGATTAATASNTAAPVASGFVYHPVTSGMETVAFRLEEDGRYKNAKGGMGSFVISADSSNAFKIEFTFNCVMGDFIDGALTPNVVYLDTAFPTFNDARCALDRTLVDEFFPVVRSVSIDLQGEAALRKDANQTSGLIAARVTKRTPQIVLTAEAMLADTFPVYEKMADTESVTVGFRGTAPDNTVWIWGNNGQITTNPEGSADGFSTMDMTLRMNGVNGNDELWIAFLD